MLRIMRLLALSLFACVLWSQSWTPLFDGKSFAGWKPGFLPGLVTASWEIAAGALRPLLVTRTTDLFSTMTYRDFVLEFEIKIAPHANGGIRYLVQERGAAWRCVVAGIAFCRSKPRWSRRATAMWKARAA